MNWVCMTEEHAKTLRRRLQEGNGLWEEAAWELRRWAEDALTKGPWSVTNSDRHAPSGDPRDYFSEAPYFWPNPADPKGPYIRRDGEVYPGRFDRHRKWLGELAQTVTALTMGGYYLEEKAYLRRAAELIRAWFLDEKTGMHPHWRYGQAIPGICDGRPIGIIEVNSVDNIVYCLSFFGDDPEFAPLLEGMRGWIGRLLDWLLIPGGFGEDEWLHGNNHSTWCVVHLAMFAAYTDRPEVIRQCVQIYKEHLLGQIAADGSLPLELERTRSYHYSRYALDPFAVICEIVRPYGYDLWECENEAGGSLRRAAEYFLPAMENPFSWRYPQIIGDATDDSYFFQLAAERLHMPECSRVNRLRREGYRPVRMQVPFGPLCLQEGLFEE